MNLRLRCAWVALFEALDHTLPPPHATRVFDPRAMGLLQVKAIGLVVAHGHFVAAERQHFVGLIVAYGHFVAAWRQHFVGFVVAYGYFVAAGRQHFVGLGANIGHCDAGLRDGGAAVVQSSGDAVVWSGGEATGRRAGQVGDLHKADGLDLW